MKATFGFLIGTAALLWGQSASPHWQEFSIGPPKRFQAGWPPNGIRADGVPLRRALAHAYGVPETRILGPSWLDDTRYAITGIVTDPKDFEPLFQQELANQFHMLAHRENRVVPVYVLKRLSGPTRLSESPNSGTITTSAGSDGNIGLNLPRARMPAFIDILANAAGRPVLDETNLDGAYQFVLSWKPRSTAALQAAVRDQLGLDLSDERRAVDLVVIDHIEKLEFAK